MERITIEELNIKILNNEVLFVSFTTEWCGQCKMSKLLINKVKKNYSNIIFVDVDVDDNDLWDNNILNISQVPTFVGFKGKKTIFNESGYQIEDDLINLLNKL
ncbi:MAG: thioredoxin family protein [Mycoplasmataceae bacterium]|nr:thioredoxin family protein [Mycoplasmataceae bacterium]